MDQIDFSPIGDLELENTDLYKDQYTQKSFIVGIFDIKEVQHYSTKPHAPVWVVWVGNEIDFVERYYLARFAVRHRPKPGHLAVFFSSIVFKY